jgi:hypothetical protein
MAFHGKITSRISGAALQRPTAWICYVRYYARQNLAKAVNIGNRQLKALQLLPELSCANDQYLHPILGYRFAGGAVI